MHITHFEQKVLANSDWVADERWCLKLEQTWREIATGNYDLDNHLSTPPLNFPSSDKDREQAQILTNCLMSPIRRPRTNLLGLLVVKNLVPTMRAKMLKVLNLVGFPWMPYRRPKHLASTQLRRPKPLQMSMANLLESPCTYLGCLTQPPEGENWPSVMGQQRGSQGLTVTM